MIRDQLIERLRKDEGTGPMVQGRSLPYFDCCGKFFRRCTCAVQGKLTIGIGWNLEDNGLPQHPVDWLLDSAINETSFELQRRYPWMNDMQGNRYAAVLMMAFNMGVPRFATFHKMLAALKDKDYCRASEEALDSEWRKQVKGRALRLARQMRTGEWQD